MTFSTVEGLHAFVCDPVHREGWGRWNRTVHKRSHIEIMHEVYAAPPGAWENMNVNFVPFGMVYRRNEVGCQNCEWGPAEEHSYESESEGVAIDVVQDEPLSGCGKVDGCD